MANNVDTDKMPQRPICPNTAKFYNYDSMNMYKQPVIIRKASTS